MASPLTHPSAQVLDGNFVLCGSLRKFFLVQQARTLSYNLHRVSGVLRLRRAGGGLWYAIPYHTIGGVWRWWGKKGCCSTGEFDLWGEHGIEVMDVGLWNGNDMLCHERTCHIRIVPCYTGVTGLWKGNNSILCYIITHLIKPNSTNFTTLSHSMSPHRTTLLHVADAALRRHGVVWIPFIRKSSNLMHQENFSKGTPQGKISVKHIAEGFAKGTGDVPLAVLHYKCATAGRPRQTKMLTFQK